VSPHFRLPSGGLIDRTRTLRFTFDGVTMNGHPGDTLAAALIANGVRVMARSFKYHRPRGAFSAGSEEPSALVTLHQGPRTEPNARATTTELFDGLQARGQNCWPALRLDLMAVNDLLSPLLVAGFYYKTFMWPPALWERLYEPLIRRAAGLGRLSGANDPDTADRGHLHCDLLVIGAGPAGLMAALTAARAGARVILADEDFRPGGRLLAETRMVGEVAGASWAETVRAELAAIPGVRLMPRTTVFGVYDQGVYGAVERVGEHLATVPPDLPCHTLWRIRARRAILCAGATERPVAFPGNDRPGILLAGALRAYCNRWVVVPGHCAALFANNDDARQTVADLAAAGVAVAAVIDPRADALPVPGVEHFAGAQVVATRGRAGLHGLTLRLADGTTRRIRCDALAVSGGWNPNGQLASHHRGRPLWDDAISAFVPGPDLPPGLTVAGAAAGRFSTHAALAGGAAAAVAACADLGLAAGKPDIPAAEDAPVVLSPFWHVADARGRAFVDLQHDVTLKDIAIAHRENFHTAEHLKRYTTLGMGTDQGRSAGILGLAAMAALTGRTLPETGAPLARPPYTPVPIAAFAGRSRGKAFRPLRLTPSHGWAAAHGADFLDAGTWKRAAWFKRPGETGWRDTVDREVLAVRATGGICDISTLGKIDVQGADAATLLDLVYCNRMATLKPGRVRYGLMLREDGMVMDDGTAARLAWDRFLISTTTANAAAVLRHLDFAQQCLVPELDVQITPVSDHWAQFAIAGPRARQLLKRMLDEGCDITDAALPFMGWAPVRLRAGGLAARLFRISFSGELGYEIALPARYGADFWARLAEEARSVEMVPCGLEALNVLRIEKGHVTGAEINGQVSAHMLGMGSMIATGKDSIGSVLARRTALCDPEGPRLVGLRVMDAGARLVGGAHLLAVDAPARADQDAGHITSVAHSPHLGRMIGLAFLDRGALRLSEVMRAVSPVDDIDTLVEIVRPCFIDRDGGRMRG